MKKNLKRLVFLAIFIAILIVPYLVFAAGGPLQNMKDVATIGGYASADQYSMSAMAGRIVRIALSLLGVIFLSLTLYGGFLWMTAQGDSGQVDKAKTIIKNSTIGIIILTAAFGIYLIVSKIMDAGTT
jgi:hypothetical protein